MFLIGPYDISSSLKTPGKFGDPIYLNYIDKIYDVISLDKLGLFLPTNKDINNYKNLNKKRPNLLIWGMDTDFILESLKNINLQLW